MECKALCATQRKNNYNPLMKLWIAVLFNHHHLCAYNDSPGLISMYTNKQNVCKVICFTVWSSFICWKERPNALDLVSVWNQIVFPCVLRYFPISSFQLLLPSVSICTVKEWFNKKFFLLKMYMLGFFLLNFFLLKMYMLGCSGHPRCKNLFLIRTDLEKCSITPLAHKWILCSGWVPSEWEFKWLIKTSQQSTSNSYYSSSSINELWREKL